MRVLYNAGEWTNYLTTSQQNQLSLWMSEDAITTELFYNQRFCIDSRSHVQGLESYLTWHVAKVENQIPPGITRLILSQEPFDPTRDKFDTETGYLYADYSYVEKNQTVTRDEEFYYSKILYNGNAYITVGGTGKRLSLQVFDVDDYEVEGIEEDVSSATVSDCWSFKILNKDETEFESGITFDEIISQDKNPLSIKLKISDKHPELLGKKLELHGHMPDGTCDTALVLNIKSL